MLTKRYERNNTAISFLISDINIVIIVARTAYAPSGRPHQTVGELFTTVFGLCDCQMSAHLNNCTEFINIRTLLC